MTDVELDVADSFERVFPVPVVVADWDDVLDRAEASSRPRTQPPSRWRIQAVARSPSSTGIWQSMRMAS